MEATPQQTPPNPAPLKFKSELDLIQYSLSDNGTQSSSNSKINNFDQYLDLILASIGITDQPIIKTIKSKFNKYEEKTFKLMNHSNLKDLIDPLLKANSDFNKVLFDPSMGLKEYYDLGTTDFKKNWDKLMEQFVILQALIIIKKIDKNINSGIDSIINALVDKLTAVNNLVEKNLF
jgi:hemerythrin-like domain-containing protein